MIQYGKRMYINFIIVQFLFIINIMSITMVMVLVLLTTIFVKISQIVVTIYMDINSKQLVIIKLIVQSLYKKYVVLQRAVQLIM